MVTHLTSIPEGGYIDKYRTDKSFYKTSQGSYLAGACQDGSTALFTANGAGTTTTLVGAAASLTASTNCPRLGERFVLVDSTGKLKENTVFQVTAHNGTTTVTFSPAAATATASGDKAILVGNALNDNDTLDARLLVAGGIYTQGYVDHMTQNDKIYAVRQLENADSVR